MNYENINSLIELAERLQDEDPAHSASVRKLVLLFDPANRKARNNIRNVSKELPATRFLARVRMEIAKVLRIIHIRTYPVELVARIIELAAAQEDHHPFDAYLLYRTIRMLDPRNAQIAGKVSAFETLFRQDLMLAYRADGLCQRLITILQGYFAARHFAYDFRFIWPDDTHLQTVFDLRYSEGHSVDTDVEKTLAADFVARHMLATGEQEAFINAIPRGSARHHRFTFRRLSQLRPRRDLIRPCWVVGNLVIPDLSEIVRTRDYRHFFDNVLFTPEIREKLDEVRNLDLPEKRVAIHLRGGDVVYGNSRKRFSAARDLSLTLAVAEEICQRQLDLGYTVYIFGATRNDIDYLTDKYLGARSANDLDWSPADDPTSVLREVALMADCEKLFAAKISAVSDLASLLGRAAFFTGCDVLPPEEEYRVSSRCIKSGIASGFHPLQRAYLQFSAFLTAPASVPIGQLKSYVLRALDDDDDRIQYWFLAYLCALAEEDDALLAISRARLETRLDTSPENYFENENYVRRFVRLNEPSVQRLLHAASRSAMLTPAQNTLVAKMLR